MKKIENLDKLTFTNWNNIIIDSKNITKKWGKTYFYVKNNTLYYENLSWPKRIFLRIFFSKKVEKNKQDLWDHLIANKKMTLAYPKKDFRLELAKVFQCKLVPITAEKKPVESPKVSKQETKFVLDSLIKDSSKENNAYLIDFSKINPSNIFKIFKKKTPLSIPGEAFITDDPLNWPSGSEACFKEKFPKKYSIEILTEKNAHGSIRSMQRFTMDEQGRVETDYQKVFNNFDEYLNTLKSNRYSSIDFISTNDFKLRKKLSS